MNIFLTRLASNKIFALDRISVRVAWINRVCCGFKKKIILCAAFAMLESNGSRTNVNKSDLNFESRQFKGISFWVGVGYSFEYYKLAGLSLNRYVIKWQACTIRMWNINECRVLPGIIDYPRHRLHSTYSS